MPPVPGPKTIAPAPSPNKIDVPRSRLSKMFEYASAPIISANPLTAAGTAAAKACTDRHAAFTLSTALAPSASAPWNIAESDLNGRRRHDHKLRSQARTPESSSACRAASNATPRVTPQRRDWSPSFLDPRESTDSRRATASLVTTSDPGSRKAQALSPMTPAVIACSARHRNDATLRPEPARCWVQATHVVRIIVSRFDRAVNTVMPLHATLGSMIQQREYRTDRQRQ